MSVLSRFLNCTNGTKSRKTSLLSVHFIINILLLRHSNNLNATLQTKNLCAVEAQTIAKHHVDTLKKMRTDKIAIFSEKMRYIKEQS